MLYYIAERKAFLWLLASYAVYSARARRSVWLVITAAGEMTAPLQDEKFNHVRSLTGFNLINVFLLTSFNEKRQPNEHQRGERAFNEWRGLDKINAKLDWPEQFGSSLQCFSVRHSWSMLLLSLREYGGFTLIAPVCLFRISTRKRVQSISF